MVSFESCFKCSSLQFVIVDHFKDGTLIDLCGATLLWRTADGLRKSPTAQELEMALDRLNAGKPQCPVNLNTLIIPKKKSSKGGGSRQPYVSRFICTFFSSTSMFSMHLCFPRQSDCNFS